MQELKMTGGQNPIDDLFFRGYWALAGCFFFDWRKPSKKVWASAADGAASFDVGFPSATQQSKERKVAR